MSATGPSGLPAEPERSADVTVRMQDDGVVRLHLPPGQAITGSLAINAAENVVRLSEGDRVCVLLDLAGVESISREARNVFGLVPNLTAVAVVGSSPVDKVIATFLLGGSARPSFPTRYFSSEARARQWLEEQRA